MTEQPATRDKTNAWDKNKWPEKNSGECHILKIKREVPGNSELTGKQSRIKAWFRLDTGRSKGAEFDAIVPEQEAQQSFKFWVNVEALAIDQEYVFGADDQPRSMVVYRNGQWKLDDIQTDFTHRAKVIQEMMIPHGLGVQYNTADNREKIRNFDTTAQAVEWANEYIKEHSKPMTDKTEAPDKLGDWFPRDTDIPADENILINGKPIDELKDDFPHELDPEKAVFAIPNHMKKTYGNKAGLHVRNVFGMDLGQWLKQHNNDTRQAWGMVEDYEAKTPVEAKSNEKATNLNESDKTPPTTPETVKPLENAAQSTAAKPTEPEVSEAEFVEETPKALAIRQPDTSFTGRALFPTQGERQVMSNLADDAFRSGLLPKQIKSVHAAKFIVETGRELGIPASLALRKLHLINGNMGMAAELMWAMVLNSGKLEDFEITESESSCTVMVKRMGMRPYTTTFTLDMARKMITTEYDNGQPKRIPLADKPTWKQMPGVMCKWRALSVACRTVFPDITLGLYSREELEDAIDFNAQPELAVTA